MLVFIALVREGMPPALPALIYLAAVTPALWSTDVAERRLPNRLVLPGYAPALAGVLAAWLGAGTAPGAALACGAGYLGFLLALSLAGGMGMGDVKLAGVLGLSAGLVEPWAAIAAVVGTFLLGGVGALVGVVRGGRGTGIPFGPYLLAGFWGAVLLAWLSPGGSST
jgi:leader peptidase (prepilin peptidase)/N-methyltransferase